MDKKWLNRWIRIEPICGTHVGPTLIRQDGAISYSDCPDFRENFFVATTFEGADISLCAKAAAYANRALVDSSWKYPVDLGCMEFLREYNLFLWFCVPRGHWVCDGKYDHEYKDYTVL